MASLLQHVVHGFPVFFILLLSAPATALLSRRPLRLVGFGGAMVFSLDGAVLAFVLWVGALSGDGDPGPGRTALLGLAAWTPWLLGYLASEATSRERRPAVRAYNIGLSALAGALFVATALGVRRWVAFAMIGDASPSGVGVWDLAAVVLGSVAYVATDLLLSAAWVARIERGSLRTALADPAALIGGATVLAVNCTAVLAAVLLVMEPWALLLLAPVAAALVVASRTGTVALTEHARAGALYQAAAGCQQATTRDEVVAAVLAAAGEAAAAPAVVGTDPPGPDQVGCPVREPGDLTGEDPGDGTGQTWLVVGPRANRNAFDEGDRTAVATLAALCEQSLARIEALRQTRWVADHDALTGALSRGAFLRTVAGSLTPSTAVLFCDVDRFKAVNDTYGHRVGDRVLVAVARALADVVGEHGTVGRLGGDELVVLLPAPATGMADLLRATLLESDHLLVDLPGTRVRVELSVGVATVADLGPRAYDLAPDDLAEALLERADARMYADKRAGRVG